METIINVKNTNFHPVLKDIENIFWFFLLSVRTLSDDQIRNLLKVKNDTQEGYSSFNEMLNKFDEDTNIQITEKDGVVTSKLDILSKMVFIGRAMAVVAYEYLKKSDYHEKIKNDIEFKFLYHIRNGSAHDNKFNFKHKDGNWSIEEDEVIEWEQLKICRRLQDGQVFNNFISLFQVFLLIQQLSDKLTMIDNNQHT